MKHHGQIFIFMKGYNAGRLNVSDLENRKHSTCCLWG